MLKLNLGHRRLIKWHMHVGGENTALGGRGRRDEEVEALGGTCITARVLDQPLINDATRGGILKTFNSFDEESLRDAFVHHDQSDLRGFVNLVVHLGESLLELVDLLAYNLVTHCVANSISVDNVVGWEITVVTFCESFNGLLESILHLGLNNLLTFPLDEVLGVVLAHLRIDRAGQADNGVWS